MSARITNTYRMFRLFGPTTPLFCNGIPVRNVNAGITIAGNGFKENLSFFCNRCFCSVCSNLSDHLCWQQGDAM